MPSVLSRSASPVTFTQFVDEHGLPVIMQDATSMRLYTRNGLPVKVTTQKVGRGRTTLTFQWEGMVAVVSVKM
jgi:hypothetical protein